MHFLGPRPPAASPKPGRAPRNGRLRVLALGVLVLALAGCASVPFVYKQIDWLAPLYVQKYVSLDREQRGLLRRELGELRDWHCGTQVASYAAWVQRVAADVRAGDMTNGRVAAHYAQLREAWQRLLGEAGPGTAELLLSLSPRQVDELFEALEKDNASFERKYMRSRTAALERYVGDMEKQLRRWIGRLTPEQHELVVQWGERVWPSAGVRLAARRQWQDELRRLLQGRDDRTGAQERIRTLITNPESYWHDELRAAQELYRAEVLDLLASVARTLTPAQREHILGRARVWSRDFESMACAGGRAPLRASAPSVDG